MINEYEQTPKPGSHRGNADGLKSGMSVRAQPAPDAQPPQPPADVVFQFARHKERGLYRMRRWQGDDPDLAEGYEEVGRYGHQDYMAAFTDLASESYYIVFENTDTGEVFMGGMNNLSDNWTGDGRFDQITIFDTEPEAAAYAEEAEQRAAGKRDQ